MPSVFSAMVLLGAVIAGEGGGYPEYHERATHRHLSKASLLQRASRSSLHEVVFAVKQNGIEELEARLRDISDPSSPRFGRHMTHEEIAAITATDSSAEKVVEFLRSRGARVVRSTSHGEYITALWTVGGWEDSLSAKFFRFEYAGAEVVRTMEYSLPEELRGHVSAVFNTVQVLWVSRS